MSPKKIIIPLLFAAAIFITSSFRASNSLSLTKSASPTTFGSAGEVITYTYVVTNTGTGTLPNYSIMDNDAEVNCPQGKLLPGDVVTCTTYYIITAADVTAGRVNTTATVTSTLSGGDSMCSPMASVSASAKAEVKYVPGLAVQAVLELVKSADTASYSQVGEVITYTYEVTNTTVITPTEQLYINDDRVQVDCPVNTSKFMTGSTITCSGTYTVTMDDVRAGRIVNQASAQVGALNSPIVSLEIPLAAAPGLSLAGSAYPPFYTFANDRVNLVLHVTNSGNVPLAGPLVINDPKVSNWYCPANPIMDMLPGVTVDCSTILYIPNGMVGSYFQDAPIANMTFNGAGVASNEGTITVSYLPPPTPWVNCTSYMTPDSCEAAGCYYEAPYERCIPRP